MDLSKFLLLSSKVPSKLSAALRRWCFGFGEATPCCETWKHLRFRRPKCSLRGLRDERQIGNDVKEKRNRILFICINGVAPFLLAARFTRDGRCTSTMERSSPAGVTSLIRVLYGNGEGRTRGPSSIDIPQILL